MTVSRSDEASLVSYNQNRPFVEKYNGKAPAEVKKIPKAGHTHAIGHTHPPKDTLAVEITKMDINALLDLIQKLNFDIEHYRHGEHKFQHVLSVQQEIAEDKTTLFLAKSILKMRLKM
jgi:hypothetical protein